MMSFEAEENSESLLCNRLSHISTFDSDCQCLNSCDNGQLLLSNCESEGSSLETSGQPSKELISMKAAPLSRDTCKEGNDQRTEMDLSDEEVAIRDLSSLPVEDDTERRVLCTRCR
ncbi:Hypothetical predicted protein [Pelobates cultripes]|uniref:Uncharacterized protein n=1 Tax=Pelobates cultripes TaxID=61616 RepID=A0AAD1WB79_PELCU|nr:Hypothetical predicted protein [Pelobates cultripes]